MTALPWAGLSVIKRGVTSVTVVTVQCSAGDVSPLQQTSSPPSLLSSFASSIFYYRRPVQSVHRELTQMTGRTPLQMSQLNNSLSLSSLTGWWRRDNHWSLGCCIDCMVSTGYLDPLQDCYPEPVDSSAHNLKI